MKSIISNLNKAATSTYKKYLNEIEDIILFGSYMKGKENSRDIDVIIIFRKKIIKPAEKMFRNQISELNVDCNSITKEELNKEEFFAKEGIYLEGISLLTKKTIAESMGFSSLALIKYNLKQITGSKRVTFYYALLGRNDQKGILERLEAKKFAENTIICEYNKLERMKEFLDLWKIPYNIIPALIPKRLKHILLKKH